MAEFKIWKLEQDLNEQKAYEAKTKSEAGAADNSNNLEDELLKTTIHNKEMETFMETLGGSRGVITNPMCVPDSVLGEQIIPHPETRGAEVEGGAEAAKQGKTLCDRTLDTAASVGATKHLSTDTPLELARQATLVAGTEEGGGKLAAGAEVEAGAEAFVAGTEESRGKGLISCTQRGRGRC